MQGPVNTSKKRKSLIKCTFIASSKCILFNKHGGLRAGISVSATMGLLGLQTYKLLLKLLPSFSLLLPTTAISVNQHPSENDSLKESEYSIRSALGVFSF